MSATVLFVDDDTDLLAAFRRSFRSEPWTQHYANGPEQALALLRTTPVDVLVTDEQMPGMNGIDLLVQVRRVHPAVVGIMLSGIASVGLVVHAVNDGQVFRFLLKPLRADDVALAVRDALATKRIQDGLALLVPLLRQLRALQQGIAVPGHSLDADAGSAPRLAIADLAAHIEAEMVEIRRMLGGDPPDQTRAR
jgi:DNA-binding NtrC family response regulator